MSLRRNRRKERSSGEMPLQITSMADIFTILLVFLLKSTATSIVNISPSDGLKMPTAQGSDVQSEDLRLEISESAIQVENKFVMALTNFRFSQETNTSELNRTLETEKKRQELIAKVNSDVQQDHKILIISDRRVPYVTIKSVLASAAASGFSNFKLVVARKE